MKFKSQVFTAVSGSIGGITYARNRGGLYTRARAIPVNPNSTDQQIVRANFAFLVDQWTNTLTDTQRAAWTTYAENTPVTDRLGDQITLTGQQMYLRNNSIRLRDGLAVVQEGPSGGGGIPLSPVTLLITVTVFNLLFDDTDSWAYEDAGGLIVQNSRQLQSTINFFRAPYRFAQTILAPLKRSQAVESLNCGMSEALASK